jgi:hypothetical protein
MIQAFEAHYGQSFTDKDWRNETGIWAAAWGYAVRQATAAPTAPAQSLEQPFTPDWVNYRQGFEDGKAEAGKPLTPAMLIEAALSASAAGLISGSTNWAAHVLQSLGAFTYQSLTDADIEACMKKAYATAQGRQLEHAFARAIEAHIKGETK